MDRTEAGVKPEEADPFSIRPTDAYNDLVTRVIAEVRKAGFGDNPDEALKLPWTPTQFWLMVKNLADKDTVSYDEIKNSAPFGKKDAPLLALEDAEIISLEYEKGRPYRIRVGRPIARVAFQQMVKDDVRFAAAMNVRECEETMATLVEKNIKPAEEELETLRNVVGGGILWGFMGWRERRAVEARVRQLVEAIGSSTMQIEKLNAERAKWKVQM